VHGVLEPNCLNEVHSAANLGSVRLMASRERISGQCIFPRIPDHSPAASRFESIELSAEATLYSFTIIHPNPKTGEKPFVVIYADFPEGARAFGRLKIAGDQHPRIGMKLRVLAENSESTSNFAFSSAEEVAQ
jgi:uncharacterized OB-fold protein